MALILILHCNLKIAFMAKTGSALAFSEKKFKHKNPGPVRSGNIPVLSLETALPVLNGQAGLFRQVF
ncbi:hypothetical protein [Desulfonema ishimotonii]|uniref:hypothetical protein n=1 Tax=Desulfonema ishimotonii TaxID=45657 RepID=UPI0014092ACB|nr:hypothetical protein [Desulfonema ishimotonii]